MDVENAMSEHEPTPTASASPKRKTRSGGAPTIYDVAELAGVNPSTVSRALGKPGRVSAPTEAKIRAAAAELNFHINPMARALPTGRTKTFSLVVADITNPMIFGLVRGAEKAASAAGYTLIIAESQESGEAEENVIDQIMPGIDGIILATTRLGGDRIAALAERKPVVLINRVVEGVSGIVPDVESGAEALMAHLQELGHRSIAYVSGPSTSWISARRWEVILGFAEKLGMAAVEIGPGQPTIEGGRELYRRVIASRATAVIAYNDLMAIGLLQSATESEVAVPLQLSIAGFDDIFGSELITPALTTVRAPLIEAGERAVARLLRVIERQGQADETAQGEEPLATKLVVRRSTGPAPALKP